MSYILEALKKSEQERNIGHVPDLAAVQEVAPARGARWPWILSVALLVNALALTLFAWKPWESPVSAPPARVAQAVPTDVQPPVQSQVTEPAPQTAQARQPVEAAPVVTDTAIPATIEQEPEDMAQTLQPDPSPIMPIEQIDEQANERAMATQFVEPSVDAPRRDDVQRWQDLPADQRSRLPTPRMDVHVFAQDPARRFVMIDLRKYQEGDRLPQGVTLVAIRAEGIVLSYQGQQYRVERP